MALVAASIICLHTNALAQGRPSPSPEPEPYEQPVPSPQPQPSEPMPTPSEEPSPSEPMPTPSYDARFFEDLHNRITEHEQELREHQQRCARQLRDAEHALDEFAQACEEEAQVALDAAIETFNNVRAGMEFMAGGLTQDFHSRQLCLIYVNTKNTLCLDAAALVSVITVRAKLLGVTGITRIQKLGVLGGIVGGGATFCQSQQSADIAYCTARYP